MTPHPPGSGGQARRSAKTFADVDLAAISQRISASIERAQQTDPRALRKRIAELEAELAAAGQADPVPAHPQPVLDAEATAQLELALGWANAAATRILDTQSSFEERIRDLVATQAQTLRQDANEVLGALTALTEQIAKASQTHQPSPPARSTQPKTAPIADAALQSEQQPLLDGAPPAGVTPARRNLLNALAVLEGIGVMQVGKIQLALWAGVVQVRP